MIKAGSCRLPEIMRNFIAKADRTDSYGVTYSYLCFVVRNYF